MMKLLTEMARFGKDLECGKDKVDIELHGGKDRIYPPHIHIYHSKERAKDLKLFSIEVNLAYFMWTGDIIPCRILDKKKNVDRQDSINTSWINYIQYHETIKDFLFDGEVDRKYSSCIDNIAVAIKVFNDEANLDQLRKEHKILIKKKLGTISLNDKFLAVMYCYGNKIKSKFKKYFTKELIEKFRDIFE